MYEPGLKVTESLHYPTAFVLSFPRSYQETVSHNFRSITNESDYAAEFNRLICLIDYVLDRIPSHASQIRIAESLRDAIYAMHEEDC